MPTTEPPTASTTFNTSKLGLATSLRSLLNPALPSRPFVVDGRPEACDVAIIGINPGSSMPFWDFWNDDTGFDRTAWVRHYYSRPGAKRNATRNRIELLVQALTPLRVIELNAYPYATKREQDIKREMKDGRVLAFMLHVARPKAIFLFGREPARVVGAMLGIGCPLPGTIQPARVSEQDTLVIAETHLARGWSYERVAQVGAQVRQIVCEGRASRQFAR